MIRYKCALLRKLSSAYGFPLLILVERKILAIVIVPAVGVIICVNFLFSLKENTDLRVPLSSFPLLQEILSLWSLYKEELE